MAKQIVAVERLKRWASEQVLVRISRHKGWDRCDGYVAGIGSKWVLLSTITDSARPDGFVAVRRSDITSAKRAKSRERFVRLALERGGNWPPAPTPTGIDLDRTGELLAGFAAAFPTICVYIEREDPEVCFIGRPEGYAHKTMFLREITPNAEWDGPRGRGWSRWSFRRLTMVKAGGEYESALAAVAGRPPN